MTFREKIYELTRAIPPGRVATYGQLALKSLNLILKSVSSLECRLVAALLLAAMTFS